MVALGKIWICRRQRFVVLALIVLFILLSFSTANNEKNLAQLKTSDPINPIHKPSVEMNDSNINTLLRNEPMNVGASNKALSTHVVPYNVSIISNGNKSDNLDVTSSLDADSTQLSTQQVMSETIKNVTINKPDKTTKIDQQVVQCAIKNVTTDKSAQKQQQQSNLPKPVLTETLYEPGYMDPNPKICENLGNDLKLFISITSEPNHEKARLAIRKTWGHHALRKDISIAFILGVINNVTLDNYIAEEQNLYGDIIRGKFVDTYENLTLKTISMLEWVDTYCPKVPFVLKTDDDMFINVARLLAFIARRKPQDRAIYGKVVTNWIPVRNRVSRYYVPPAQFKPGIFPRFTTGPAYLFPGLFAKELYLAALDRNFMQLEDVFITGIVADYLKIRKVPVPEFVNGRIRFDPCLIKRVISIHNVESSKQYDLWKKLHEGKCK